MHSFYSETEGRYLTRQTVLAGGGLALALVLLVCLPRHLPTSSLQAARAERPAFHVLVEDGQVTLSGTLREEPAKQAVLARARQLFGTTDIRIIDTLKVRPDMPAGAWEPSLPALLTALASMNGVSSLFIEGETATIKGTAASPSHKANLLQYATTSIGTGVRITDAVVLAASKSVPAPIQPEPGNLQTRIAEILRGMVIDFRSNSSVLTPHGKSVLDTLVPLLRTAPAVLIDIEGHTDQYGDPQYNLQLSHRRAEAVRAYLIAQGLTNRFRAVGYGPTRLLTTEQTRAAAQRNRRIEFRVRESH